MYATLGETVVTTRHFYRDFFLCRGSGMNGGLELEVPHKYRMTCLSVTTSLWCNWCCFGSFAYSRPCNFIPSSYSVKLCKVWHVS